MAPELVEEFVREFHAEINRQRANEELQAADLQTELGRVSKKLAGLYDAIADGLRTPGLKDQLLALEDRQRELRERAQNLPAPEPRLHPKLAEAYRVTVTELHDALNDPDARTEAAEILRSLVDRISVRADADGHLIELTGDIVKLITLPGGSVPDPFASSVKVVAGARKFHKLLFGARGLEPASNRDT